MDKKKKNENDDPKLKSLDPSREKGPQKKKHPNQYGEQNEEGIDRNA
ncbi:hypothetical protein [Altibacter sp.]|nr:hypothetical protein [Altibacter sp.]